MLPLFPIIAGIVGGALVSSRSKMESGGQAGFMKAPNGRRSNLTPEQWRLVRTKNFKNWFGDWENDPENASKVVDENGEPLVVYHATDNKFNIFDIDADTANSATYFPAFYFLNEKTEHFAGDYMMEVYLSLQNPLIYDIRDSHLTTLEFQEELHKAQLGMKNEIEDEIEEVGGFDEIDGIILLNPEYANAGVIEYMVFDPVKIKLADGSNTTFDGSNPDIRYSEGGDINEHSKTLLAMFPSREQADKLASSITRKYKLPTIVEEDFTRNFPYLVFAVEEEPAKIMKSGGKTGIRPKFKRRVDEMKDVSSLKLMSSGIRNLMEEGEVSNSQGRRELSYIKNRIEKIKSGA